MIKQVEPRIISVDWGTSRLRIYLVNVNSTQIIRHFSSDMGIKLLYDQWQESGEDRQSFYLRQLLPSIKEWGHEVYGDIPVFISGMASSTIGMCTLPYATLPFHCNGAGLHVEKSSTSFLSHPVWVVSGVRSDDDVMRGEETQLIGLHQEDSDSKKIYILPGTHSKHIDVINNQVTGFQTYLTGELFDILNQYSILRESIRKAPFDDTGRSAFISGLNQSLHHRFLNDLFKIRTHDLFSLRSKPENYYFLSGLLIGQEMMHLKEKTGDRIILAASGDLANLYWLTMDVFGIPLEVISPETVDQALVNGHIKLWKFINSEKQ
jgi:2-dehydro-3-deoxygalactonokinase